MTAVSRQVAVSEEQGVGSFCQVQMDQGCPVLVQGCEEPPMTQSLSLNRREVTQEG